MRTICRGKRDLVARLSYMIVYSPDFPGEDETSLDAEFAFQEQGLSLLMEKDGRPATIQAVITNREELKRSLLLFAEGDLIPACHLLQNCKDRLEQLRVKGCVA